MPDLYSLLKDKNKEMVILLVMRWEKKETVEPRYTTRKRENKKIKRMKLEDFDTRKHGMTLNRNPD